MIPLLYFLLADHSISEISVGGIKYPKHLGQSGHPIPLPVILTTAPAEITRYTNTKLITIRVLLYFFIKNKA